MSQSIQNYATLVYSSQSETTQNVPKPSTPTSLGELYVKMSIGSQHIYALLDTGSGALFAIGIPQLPAPSWIKNNTYNPTHTTTPNHTANNATTKTIQDPGVIDLGCNTVSMQECLGTISHPL